MEPGVYFLITDAVEVMERFTYERQNKHFFKKSGVFFTEKIQEDSSCPPKNYNLQNKPFRKLKTRTEMCGTEDIWIAVSCQTIFLRM